MILITGANGLLGSYLCRQLLEKEKPFIALVRPSANLELLSDIRDSINFQYGDITDMESLQEIIPQIDTIIHCAAIVSYNKADKEKIFDVNVNGTRNLINQSLSNKVKYFIHISSVAAIGRNKLVGTVSEDEKWENGKWHTRYAESKYMAELEVWRGMAEGLNAVVLNPSLILGQGNWNKSSARLFKYVWEERPFYTEGNLNYVDIRDVSKVIFKILKEKIVGKRYIINGGCVSYKTFFDRVALQFGKKAPYIKANKVLIKLALALQKIKSSFSTKEPVITRETATISKNKIYFDNSKIKKDLNLNFAPFAQTIDWTCEFYLKKQRN